MTAFVASLRVLRPGLQSTVQDAGRRVRDLGVPAAGAADPVARQLANALVGNSPETAGLEVTLSGPTLRFGTPALVAVCGAPFPVMLDGQPVSLGRGLTVRAGQTLALGHTPRGLRAFLAVRGGLLGQEVYGSRSTDLRGGFGGLEGRALREGDELHWPAGPLPMPFPGRLSPGLTTPTGPHHPLRVLPTPEATPEQLRALCGPTFRVTGQLDRMGVRLGPAVASAPDPGRVSLPTVPGLVQLPPGGQPTVLLCDAGTHGGYPAPLVVAGVDRPRLGQLRPGDTVTFHPLEPDAALRALRDQQRALASAEGALRWWFGSTQ